MNTVHEFREALETALSATGADSSVQANPGIALRLHVSGTSIDVSVQTTGTHVSNFYAPDITASAETGVWSAIWDGSADVISLWKSGQLTVEGETAVIARLAQAFSVLNESK